MVRIMVRVKVRITVSQYISDDWEGKKVLFMYFIKRVIKERIYSLRNIIYMWTKLGLHSIGYLIG